MTPDAVDAARVREILDLVEEQIVQLRRLWKALPLVASDCGRVAMLTLQPRISAIEEYLTMLPVPSAKRLQDSMSIAARLGAGRLIAIPIGSSGSILWLGSIRDEGPPCWLDDAGDQKIRMRWAAIDRAGAAN